MARQTAKRRRSTDAQSIDQDQTEVPRETPVEKGDDAASTDALLSTSDVAEHVISALTDQKAALDARMTELTMGKPIARIMDPGFDVNGHRLKRTHRDFLLQEMEWMAADFAQERKWRMKSAKMLAGALVNYHNNQASRAARQLKMEEEAKRRLAARIGRDVKKFWTKIDKIISYKVKLQADEMRKAAMDRHLKNLVTQTERYASALAMTFQQDAEPSPLEEEEHKAVANSVQAVDAAKPKQTGAEDAGASSDSEFELPENQTEVEMDDESTMEQEEAMESKTKQEQDEDMTLLQQESEMSIEELRARYGMVPAEPETPAEQSNKQEKAAEGDAEASSDSDFAMNSGDEELDDEESIALADKATSKSDVDEEMALLKQEQEMTVKELRAKYARAFQSDESEMDEDKQQQSTETALQKEESSAEQNDETDDDFEPMEEDEPDDETTIEEAEREDDSKGDAEDEIRLLQEESELSIEALRARYASALGDNSEEDDDQMREDESKSPEHEKLKPQSNGTARRLRPRTRRSLTEDIDSSANIQDNLERKFEHEQPKEETEVAESTAEDSSAEPLRRPTGGFKRPYLLTSRLNLREYQEAGVNWLVSMCEKRINGILADEMGLGKTIQTITMLAHLACARNLWGPHLIVVPTSCLVNWEMEFKRWCPAFKVLTYFGSAKRRKMLRQGWSKQNAFQICITSYQLVVQDAHCFKRKKWYYLILDEAHNIKNWKSLRWQTLLNFNSQRRLLLTGTPLQNNIMELWALMHFLMPTVFASRKEFTYWFQNPLSLMVEGEQDVNQQLVTQLHGIIRPFVLRRLKKDVAKQMPGKFEHVITCKLSKRQRFLYEDFISRSSTRRAMRGSGGGNFMSMMNVLMQLRKVCNHPDLFEPRPISSPLDMPSLSISVPSRCGFLVDYLSGEDWRTRAVPFWTANLPTREIYGYEHYTSQRRKSLYFYDDLSLSLPPDASVSAKAKQVYADKRDILQRLVELATKRQAYWQQKRIQVAELSRLRVELSDQPMYGHDLIQACMLPVFISHAMEVHVQRAGRRRICDPWQCSEAMTRIVKDPSQRIADLQPVVAKAVCYVPKARARPLQVQYGGSGFAIGTDAHKQPDFVLSRKNRMEVLEERDLRPLAQQMVDPFYESYKRTQLFFPDKRLLQFDCGKLQQLDLLLRKLKSGGHRCLIFTQMSSMLNILEIFLNIHGHTYFRLDGSTKVEKRQSLMERFNHDPKVFCFILSTRSGGLGINLTGADSVIFYDSDWNPAMDAQAQDRAHRIGQTRDVHIYRLVSEHTVEENILKKAQQKRHLDFLVMAEGQFTTDFFSKSSLRELVRGIAPEGPEDAMEEPDSDEDDDMSYDAIEHAMAQVEDEEDVVAMKGAKEEFLSEQREFDEDNGATTARTTTTTPPTSSKPSTPSQSVHSSMSEQGDDDDDDGHSVAGSSNHGEETSLLLHEVPDLQAEEHRDESDEDEDLDDSMDENEDDHQAVKKRKRASSQSKSKRSHATKRARRGEKKTPPPKDAQAEERAKEKAREKQMELDEENKLQAWKDSVSSLQGFEDSLNPVDRYALHFREDIDPLYSYVPTAAALASHYDAQHAQTLDLEAVEAEKMAEEAALLQEGELIVGIDDGEVEFYHDLYKKERAHVHFERRKRQLTGAAWTAMKCVKTNIPFYFNTDTREASWDRPMSWLQNEQLALSMEQGYAGLPSSVLHRILTCLVAFPDRHAVQAVCRSWRDAACHPGLYRKFNATDQYDGEQDGSDGDSGHSSTFKLVELLKTVAHGDTVVFGSGVYYLDDVVEIKTPMRWLAAPDAHVELQMTTGKAQLRWTAKGGVLCGFHLTRRDAADASDQDPVDNEPSSHWQHLLHVTQGGFVRAVFCDFDGKHQGNSCLAVSGSESSRLVVQQSRIFHAGSSGVLLLKGELVMRHNSVFANGHSGVSVLGGHAVLRRNKIYENARCGIRLLYHAGNIVIEENVVRDHPCGNIDVESSGRRFVIRWNEMNKDEPEDLPHMHGTLRLKTMHIQERVIEVKDARSPMNHSTPTAAVGASGLNKISTPSALLGMAPGVASAAFAAIQQRLGNTPKNTLIPGTTIGLKREIVEAVVPLAQVASQTPTISTQLAMKSLTQNVVSSVGAIATIPSSLLVTHRPSILPTEPMKAETPAKPKKPKTEKVLVVGRIVELRDTCEKRVEKIKKPRKPKLEAGSLETNGSVDTINEPVKSEATTPASKSEGKELSLLEEKAAPGEEPATEAPTASNQ